MTHDRVALLGTMTALGVAVRQYKACLAWLSEKAARLCLSFDAEMHQFELLEQSTTEGLVQLDLSGSGSQLVPIRQPPPQ